MQKKIIAAGRTIRFFGAGAALTTRDIRLLSLYEHIIRAEEELEHYRRQGILTPERAYELVLLMTDDKELALQTQSTITLDLMPRV